MFEPLRKPRVAVLGLTIEIYKEAYPDYLERSQKQLDAFLAELKTVTDISSSRICYCQKQISQQIHEAETDDVDALLVIPMSYTASLMSALPIARTSLPVIIWNTQELLRFDSNYTPDTLLMNHVTQGTQDVTSVLHRAGRIFGIESGHYQDKTAIMRLGQWLNAAKTMRFAKKMRVGLLGLPFQDMGDFGVDETLMSMTWGPYAIHITPAVLVHLLEKVSDSDAVRIIDEDKKRFDVDPAIDRETHLISARLEIAMRRLVEQYELDALSMNFRDIIDDGRFPTMPFLGLNKLLADGLGYAGEGNITVAAHMAQLRQLCGIANFTEIYTVDYVDNRMLMTHMQECNSALARKDRKVRLVRKDFWVPGMSPYVGMHFTLEPGPVTLTNILVDASNRFSYITYETSITDMQPLPKFDIPHWAVELDEPVGDFLTRYSMAGGMHHLIAVPGYQSDTLQKLAHLQNFDFTAL
ncbi:MAG TPA: hypothetical protein PKK48_06790 [Phycisphaerae bacterium]|nr:hypothetical protein [Phycisphaerae bacterium]